MEKVPFILQTYGNWYELIVECSIPNTMRDESMGLCGENNVDPGPGASTWTSATPASPPDPWTQGH
jgi:hypothetical protein